MLANVARASLVSSSLALAALTSGCTAEYFTPLRPPPHAVVARDPSQIEIFSSAPPTRPYVDVALLYVRAYSFDAAITGFRNVAAAHGCDAVVLGASLSATCIMYIESPQFAATMPPPPPPPPAVRPLPPGMSASPMVGPAAPTSASPMAVPPPPSK
jgi:hypothetical protein